MITTEQIQDLLGSGGTVVGGEGEKIGKIGQVYLDDETGKPEWVTTKTGMFGGSETFIPLAEATLDGDTIRVPYDKDKVKNAPRMDDAEGHLSKDQEAALYEYYSMAYTERTSSWLTGTVWETFSVTTYLRSRTLPDSTFSVPIFKRSSERVIASSVVGPVVEKETVPVERVRLGTETVTENHEVNEEVRKEQIDTDAGTDATKGGEGRNR